MTHHQKVYRTLMTIAFVCVFIVGFSVGTSAFDTTLTTSPRYGGQDAYQQVCGALASDYDAVAASMGQTLTPRTNAILYQFAADAANCANIPVSIIIGRDRAAGA